MAAERDIPLLKSTEITLPLSLATTRRFEVFLGALDDKKVRDGLRKQNKDLPPGISELVTAIDDKKFIEMAHDVARRYASMIQEKTPVDDVKAAGTKLQQYLTSTYPNGHALLRDYATRVGPDLLRGRVAANADVVANVEAVANAAVYVDAAVATHVAVAVIAVVVVAVFVI